MNRIHQFYIIHYLLIGMFFYNMNVFSQTNYSESALTGRGDLTLVGTHYKLQKEVFEAYKKMQKEAFKEGVSIQIVSAYRSFKRQNKIWNKKYKTYISKGVLPEKAVLKVLEYSTIPGTSRHHWGTDIDVIDGATKAPKKVLIDKNYIKTGIYSKLKIWMDSNSEKFGFYLVYDANLGRKGFKYEPWHYSYMPISKTMLHQFLKINATSFIHSLNLEGNSYLTDDFLEKYYKENILSINLKLK